MTPPDQVLELIERFERNLDAYKRADYKEARVRGEHEDMPDKQEKATQTVLEQAEVLCREWVSE